MSWGRPSPTFVLALVGCSHGLELAPEESSAAIAVRGTFTDSSESETLGRESLTLTDADALAETTRGDCTLRTGDLVFHRSLSEQAGAIAYLTKSELTHTGVVFRVGGAWNVYEAVGPVKITALDAWIARGQGARFATSRFATGLSSAQAKALFEAGKPFFGKPYDLLFTEDDTKIYCSELVLKMHQRAAPITADPSLAAALSRLWERADRLDGWAEFQGDLATPGETPGEALVKRIMAARGVDEREFASQVLVAPVTLSSEQDSGGIFREACSLGVH